MDSTNLQDKINFLKPNLIKIKESAHWIQLEDDVRKNLEEIFSTVTIEEVTEYLSVSKDLLDTLISQKTEVELIKNEVAEARNKHQGQRYIIYYQGTKKKIDPYFDLLTVSGISRITGIPRSTLDAWKQQSLKEQQTPSVPPGETHDINKHETTEKLRIMLKRHEGKVHRRYSNSEKELILRLVDTFGSKAVRDTIKVSYDTISRLKRERKRGLPTVATAAKYTPVIDVMKKYPGMGPMQIRDYVNRHYGISMGVNSVRKVMEDNGWVSSYSRRIKVYEDVRRYESIRRNHIWHIDFKHFYINKIKVYLLFIEDDQSRFITGYTFAEGERLQAVIDSVVEAIGRHGKPEIIMTDGGSAFHSWRGQSKFNQFLEDYGIDHHISKTPRVNGKVESINQKVEKEVLNVQSFSSLNRLQEELSQWVSHYNFTRPHQGLPDLQVPADRFYPGWKKFQKENSDSSNNLLDALMQVAQQLKA